jgi:hypothetical protein
VWSLALLMVGITIATGGVVVFHEWHEHYRGTDNAHSKWRLCESVLMISTGLTVIGIASMATG